MKIVGWLAKRSCNGAGECSCNGGGQGACNAGGTAALPEVLANRSAGAVVVVAVGGSIRDGTADAAAAGTGTAVTGAPVGRRL